MKAIKCRKCGAELDPTRGECSVCGAIYYVLTESEGLNDQEKPQGASSEDEEHIRLFESKQQYGKHTRIIRSGLEGDEGDYTRVFRAAEEVKRPEPQRKSVERAEGASPPARAALQQSSSPRRRSRRLAGFAVAALALLAVLVVLLSIMSGAFDFKGGDKAHTMPKVTGLSAELARDTLEKLGLTVKIQTARSDQSAGTVIEQSIPVGQKLKGNEEVLLTVSSGSAGDEPGDQGNPVEVPPLTGLSYDEAKAVLTALGLSIIRSGEEYSDQPEGRIISQEPEAGITTDKGSFVKVTLSRGPEPADEYIISVIAGKGGSVSPNGRVSVQEGGSQSFIITPDEGYEVKEVKVDGSEVGAVEEYTFVDVTDNHTLYVVFQIAPEETPTDTPEPTTQPSAEPTAEPTIEPSPENSPPPSPAETDAP